MIVVPIIIGSTDKSNQNRRNDITARNRARRSSPRVPAAPPLDSVIFRSRPRTGIAHIFACGRKPMTPPMIAELLSIVGIGSYPVDLPGFAKLAAGTAIYRTSAFVVHVFLLRDFQHVNPNTRLRSKDGTPPLVSRPFWAYLPGWRISNINNPTMSFLTSSELEKMERLLANLLRDSADERERTAILQIHGRLTRIYESQSDLRSSERRLTALTARISR